MITTTFLEVLDKYQFSSSIGLEDISDKINFIGSVTILLISAAIVTFNTLIFQPLACFSSVSPSGMNYEKYVENYCWLEGTYAFLPNETLPNPEDIHKFQHLKINYYQWIPFVLALQCVFFFLPRLLWQTFCYNKLGVDLESLIKNAQKAKNEEKYLEKCKPIANRIESILFCHRDYRHGAISSFRRKLYNYLGVLVASKRLGTWLASRYFLMKLMYLINAVVQLFLLSRFFQSNTNFIRFGYDMVVNTITQKSWVLTRTFPRVTFCFINNVRINSGKLNLTSQCAMPQNMINEKIFVFIYLWIAMVAVTTTLGIFLWAKRISYMSRLSSVKKFLDLEVKDVSVHKFVTEFLQHDGHFILYMIYLNAGDIITTGVARHLFEVYNDKYINVDLRKNTYYQVDDFTDDNMALKLRSPKTNTICRNGTAPEESVPNFL